MDLSQSTASLLDALDALSSHRLVRREDLGVLLELGGIAGQEDNLEKLSFLAKFLHRTSGIMKRIGPHGEGYETLAREFTGSLEKAVKYLQALLAVAPEQIRVRFTTAYLPVSAQGLDNLLALLHDLSWYKNWRIDTAIRPGGHG
jgi:hypothetical protein